MSLESISKELLKVAQKMENDNADYEVREHLQIGRGEGNYNFHFKAKKKGGFGFMKAIKAITDIATGAIYGGAEGAFWRALGVARREAGSKFRSTLDPIEKTLKGSDIAIILKRWAETIPQGYLETIGSDLALPKDPSYYRLKLKPGKEIEIVINFAKLRSEVEIESKIEEAHAAMEESAKKLEEAAKAVPPQPPAIPIIPAAMRDYVLSSISGIYAEGSLSNTENGFKLTLDNTYTDVGIVAPIKLAVDGVDIDPSKIKLKIGDKEIASSEINLSQPAIFKVGEKAEILVDGITLPEGNHRIDIETSIQGVGKVKFTVIDKI